MNPKKILYIVVGFVGVGLGFLGAILPLLPAFPFLLLAAICFGKSSEKLDSWFKGTKLYQNNLADFVQGQGMTKAAKKRIILTVTLLMGFSFLMMMAVPVGQICLFFVWVFHIIYFVKFVKTKEEN